MECQYVAELDSCLDFDGMINDGLGGRYIVRPYKRKQREPLEGDNEFIKRDV